MSKVGLLTSINGFKYYSNMPFSMRVEKITGMEAWSCYGSRVQLPSGVLIPGTYLWIVTDRGSELHNECSLLVFGRENMVSK